MRWLLLPIVIALVLSAPAARAQFYDLDGAYHCMTAPDQSCDKPPPPGTPPPPTPEEVLNKPPPPPPFADIVERVKQGKPTDADLKILSERVAAKDPRATEVMAWCKLNGVGMNSDPLAAFYLYGDAANLGVVNATANQKAIFEHRLTSAERQAVLVKQSSR